MMRPWIPAFAGMTANIFVGMTKIMISMNLTDQQKKEIKELEKWFYGEIDRINDKKNDIKKRYLRKKSEMMLAVVKKKIKKL